MSDIEIKNTVTQSTVHVEGDFRQGDDTYITTNNYYETAQVKTEFVQVKVDAQTYGRYLAPVFMPDVVERLERNRLLILGGAHTFNKDGFLKHLASRFALNDDALVVKENLGLQNLASLLHTIRNSTDTRCAFLLYGVSPDQLEYQFDEIKKVITAGRHYLLISTSTSKESWRFEGNDEHELWYTVRATGAYGKEDLAKRIEQGLNERNISAPAYTDWAKIANQLGTPESVDAFVEALTNKEEITPEKIEDVLQRVTPSDVSGVVPWFHNLQSDQKLLVIGFTLFNGLREIQFFDVMDILIEEGWAGRKHNLKSIDYEDVQPLLGYFKFENEQVRSVFPEQDGKLLSTAWRTHRRFIDAALPVLVKLVVLSVSNGATNWKVFGTTWHRQIIRRVVTNTFARLGIIDFLSIEHSLISLAANRNFEVRMVTADTLANLRSAMGDSWYGLLESWQKNVEFQNLVSTLVGNFSENGSERDENRERQISLNYIQATIAAALGAVAQKDPPNALDDRVLEQIKRLARDRGTLVIQAVQHTLRQINARHARQTAASIHDYFLRLNKAFISPIAAGLADCYNNLDPDGVRTILFAWLDQINQEPAFRNNHTDFLHEDKVLCCIIQTLQLIDYQSTFSQGKITVEEAYEILDHLRRTNHQSQVRSQLLQAIVTLIKVNLHHSNRQTIGYISNLDPDERDQLVKEFNRQYLAERAGLYGGDYQVRIHNKSLAAWAESSDRPETDVEKLMRGWLNHPDKTISQIATMSLLFFTNIEEQEKQAIEAYQEEQERLTTLQEAATEAEVPEYTAAIEADAYTNVFLKVAGQVVLPIHIQQLQNIAPVLLQQNQASDAQLAKIFARFDHTAGEQDEIVQQLIYLYDLFKQKEVDNRYRPFHPRFWAKALVWSSATNLSLPDQRRIEGWAPILIQLRGIYSTDVDVILYYMGALGQQIGGRVGMLRFLHRNPWIWWVLGVLGGYWALG